MQLQGKRALVTGAGRGIGAEVARALAREGASVVCSARTQGEIEALASEIGGRALVCDVSREEQVSQMASLAGEIDILVNNAGIAATAPLKNLSLQEWERILGVNATGTFLCTRAFLPGMVKNGWGRVINVASVAGRTGGRYLSAYAASKHAVLGFTRCIAEEVAKAGVTVNAVCPGFVNTPMTDQSLKNIVQATGRSRQEALEALTRVSPQNRLIEPDEVAYAVLFLADPRARGVNGQALVVDGGGLLA